MVNWKQLGGGGNRLWPVYDIKFIGYLLPLNSTHFVFQFYIYKRKY